MTNLAIARILREIADLLELKNENPFKIRAYRNGGDAVANHPHRFASLTADELRGIPGIGKDLAAKIREIADTGDCEFHRELLAEIPTSVLDLLRLQGVGPRTVAALYRELGIRTLEDLQRAAAGGQVRALRGMGSKKEALILKALDEQRRRSGQHLLAQVHDAADGLTAYLRDRHPEVDLVVVGSARRGRDTCGDLDLLAAGTAPDLMRDFVAYPQIERVLGQGATRSSVLLTGGLQADVRLVAAQSRGAAMQYFTGSKAHNIALRDRALRMGLTLNEYGLFRAGTDECVAQATEDEIYHALGLAWVPPELREAAGEIEAAESRTLPSLIELADLKGDLHSHTTATDGKDDLQAMAAAAAAAGLEYLAVTDHSQALAMANGLDETRALRHAERIRALDGAAGVRLLAGIECDIRPDGSLDLADECLAALDIVVVSIHSAFNQEPAAMTDRLLRALANRHVDILGHPTGRLLLKREPYAFDVEAVLDAAAGYGVAVEINCQTNRLDLSDTHARLAAERGARLVISSDAHSRQAFHRLRWGIAVARRAWLTSAHVINTGSLEALKGSLRRHRTGGS